LIRRLIGDPVTIIAVKDGAMAADSESVTNRGLRSPMPFPKITRGPGGLIGMTGALSDMWAVSQWFAGGEKLEDKPTSLKQGEEGVGIIILRPDGVVWRGDERLIFWKGENPSTTGMSTACYFCEGAMAAGLSAEDAVRLTISRVDMIGGPVQVEHLGRFPARKAAERELPTGWPPNASRAGPREKAWAQCWREEKVKQANGEAT
jgi:hypothetical protein